MQTKHIIRIQFSIQFFANFVRSGISISKTRNSGYFCLSQVMFLEKNWSETQVLNNWRIVIKREIEIVFCLSEAIWAEKPFEWSGYKKSESLG